MSLTNFFKKLEAPLVNSRWSWGAVRQDGSVVLRVYQDRKEKIDGEIYMMVANHVRFSGIEEKLGYQERLAHIEKIKKGAKCLMIMCLAKDVEAFPRSIKSYNQKDIFVGGRVIEYNQNTYIQLVDRYPISEL